jgi:hypothetical protein
MIPPDELHKDSLKVLRAAMDTLVDHIDYRETRRDKTR